MLKAQRLAKSKLNAILSGKFLRLREGLYKQLHDREWFFRKTEKDMIFLIHRSGAYGIVVGIEDIDWNLFWSTVPS